MINKLLHTYIFLGGLFLAQTCTSAQATQPVTTLLSFYSDAIRYNSDIAAAKADYEAQQESVPQALAGLLPSLNVGANLDTTHTTVKQPDSVHRMRSGNTFQANLNQAIFRLDRWFQLRAANATAAQAELAYAEKEQALILQTAEYYFSTLNATDNLSTYRAEEEAYKRQLDQTKGKLKGGIATITDVLDAQAAYDNAMANRQVAEKVVEDNYEQLTRLTKRHYDQLAAISHKLPPVAPIPNNSEHWAKAAMQQNLSILSSQYQVKASEETYRQRQAGHAPTVDLVVSFKQGDNDRMGYTNTSPWTKYQDAKESTIGLQLNLPLFEGGMTSSQARESHKRLTQNEELYETQRREVLLKTRNYFRALNSDITQIHSRKNTIFSSYKALKANEEGLRVGTRNMMDVLNSQRQLYAALREYNNARYNYILDNLRLKQATGLLSIKDLHYLNDFLLPTQPTDLNFLPPELASLAKK